MPESRFQNPSHFRRTLPQDDWICVKTKRHPQEEKPRHRGKISKFNQLFENSFQLHQVYDPYSQRKAHSSKRALEITYFDGQNMEYFREYEQGVLMKIQLS